MLNLLEDKCWYVILWKCGIVCLIFLLFFLLNFIFVIRYYFNFFFFGEWEIIKFWIFFWMFEKNIRKLNFLWFFGFILIDVIDLLIVCEILFLFGWLEFFLEELEFLGGLFKGLEFFFNKVDVFLLYWWFCIVLWKCFMWVLKLFFLLNWWL